MQSLVWKLLKSLESKKGITEVIINGPEQIFIERNSTLTQLSYELTEDDILLFCQEVAKLNNKDFSSENPVLDGVLPDGSRVNLISSFYTESFPAVTIRKFIRHHIKLEQSLGMFGMDEKSVSLLKSFVLSSMNVMISGGTASGKTTLLNILLNEVKPNERIITIEDTKELSLNIPNCVSLISKTIGSQVENPLGIDQLLKNSLRMRPDRIILGEVRGKEAFDLLMAMNTGHTGSMGTIHANSARECLSRIEALYLMAGYDIPLRALRYNISTSIDYVIQLKKNPQGKRVISEIVEVTGMEQDRIVTQDIATYDGTKLAFTGLVPQKMHKLKTSGVEIAL